MSSNVGSIKSGAFSFSAIPSLTALELSQKRTLVAASSVFLRADLNLKPRGNVLDPKRLTAALPCIREISDLGGILYVASHRSDPVDPKGKVDLAVSMRPVFELLREQLPGKNVIFIGDHVAFEEGSSLSAQDFSDHLGMLRQKVVLLPGTIVVLENLRFYPETVKDAGKVEQLSRSIARGFDLYVDEAFGTVHRGHASMVVPRYKPGASFVGPLMKQEMDMIAPLLVNPVRPFLGMVSGSKITTEEGKEGKIEVLEGLLPLVDHLLIFGAMGNAFLCAQLGWNRMGAFTPTANDLAKARELLGKWSNKIFLPQDLIFVAGVVSFQELMGKKDTLTEPMLQARAISVANREEDFPALWFPADIGRVTLASAGQMFWQAQTIFGNGSAGVHEIDLTASGSQRIVEMMNEAAKQGAYVLGGGGDFLSVAKVVGAKQMNLSTGGGALLATIAKGGRVPGLLAFFESWDKLRWQSNQSINRC